MPVLVGTAGTPPVPSTPSAEERDPRSAEPQCRQPPTATPDGASSSLLSLSSSATRRETRVWQGQGFVERNWRLCDGAFFGGASRLGPIDSIQFLTDPVLVENCRSLDLWPRRRMFWGPSEKDLRKLRNRHTPHTHARYKEILSVRKQTTSGHAFTAEYRDAALAACLPLTCVQNPPISFHFISLLFSKFIYLSSCF